MPPAEETVRALYEQYGPIILNRCRGILGDEQDARDALHETFVRVIDHYDEFRAQSAPLGWMYRISTNHCLNVIRNRKGRRDKRERHRDDLPSPRALQEEPARALDAALVRRLLADADPQTCAIVVHLYFDDMTRVEAARLVGVSQPTLRKRLDCFLKQARRVMDCAPDGRLALAGATVALWFVQTGGLV